MESYNIVQVLKSFTFQEAKDFRKFLNSEYYNTNLNIVKLYDFIIKYYPLFDNEELEKEKLFFSLYPGKEKYNDSTMKNLLFDILKLSEKFMLIENLKQKPIDALEYLNEELFKRKLFNLLSRSLKEGDEVLTSVRFKNSEYFINKFKIESSKLNFDIINDKLIFKSLSVKGVDRISNTGKYFVYNFISEIIKLHDNLAKHYTNYNIKPENNFLSKFIDELNIEKAISFIYENLENRDNLPIFEIYLHLLKMFANVNDVQSYFSFKDFLTKHSDTLDLDEKNYLYSRLTDYCIIQINNNSKSSFNEELLKIYSEILSKKYYRHSLNDYLPIQLFRNILLVSIRQKEYSWAEQFITENVQFINPSFKDDMYFYSYAYLFFEQNHFGKSLENLSRINLHYFTLKVDTQILLLKTYYEINSDESAFSLIDTLKHFLKGNNSITYERKAKSKNFIKYLNKLLLMRNASKKTKLEELKQEINNLESVFEKEWLTQKAEELFTTYKGVI